MNTQEYYKLMETNLSKEFEIAKQVRAKGLDFSLTPEIYIAKDTADKVEGLIEIKGVSEIIRKLQKEYDSEEEIAFNLANEVIKLKLSETNDREYAAEMAIRAGLAYLTQGAVSAPIEGIAKVKFKKNPDNSEYLAVYYAGPIRAAGGTAEALSIIVADYVRKALNLGKYQPTPAEIGRCSEEILWYKRNVHLQYMPSQEEIEIIVRNVPVCIDGEPTEEFEVVTYRDLGRVETNRVRGGMCLVIAEGIAQKASKLARKLKPLEEKYGLNWSWLEGLLAKKIAKEIPYAQERLEEVLSKANSSYNWAQDIESEDVSDIGTLVHASREAEDLIEEAAEGAQESAGNEKYMQEIPAGRPVFSHPSKKGGFILRYGRTRASGYSAIAINPATMHLLDGFIAIGTQLRLEFPGKAGIATTCETINGPFVVLDDGELTQISTVEEAKLAKNKVKKIMVLGDILISAGDFIENNHKLLPASYTEEWWLQEAREKQKNFKLDALNFKTAAELSEKLKIPLHPKYTFFWNNLNPQQLVKLIKTLGEHKFSDSIPFDQELKEILELLCVFHKLKDNKIQINPEHLKALLFTLSLDSARTEQILGELKNLKSPGVLEAVNKISPVEIRNRAPTYVGARMGRPEKAKARKMVPPPNTLFPTGIIDGRIRDIVKAAAVKPVSRPELAKYSCSNCGSSGFSPVCHTCGSRTSLVRFCPSCQHKHEKLICPRCHVETRTYDRTEINLKDILNSALARLSLPAPKKLVGVLGMTSREKVPEPIEKGILRAKNGIYVFKDGTARFDATDAPLSHFTPTEAKVSHKKLRELGYTHDMHGKELTSDTQILELKPQDIVISDFKEDGESCADYIFCATQFVDDELEKFYGLPRYYNLKKKDDLIGTLVAALAPHTSTAILGRIIGFTEAKVCFANPSFHAAKRRDCDGDEDSVMLLLDALLNFSRCFIPEKRGGRMDAPLVITSILNPLEVDNEVYDTDIVSEYPLEFYNLTLQGADSSKAKIKTFGDIVSSDDPYKGWLYTHETFDINNGVISNTYTEGEMLDKLAKQLELAEKIVAVDARDVAEKIINTHFIPDMRGNLRTFSRQKIRCTKCNTKYRRPPLAGSCIRCSGNLTFTVHRGTIEKYLKATKEMAEKYKISDYLRQQVAFLDKSIVSVFGKEKQQTLVAFK